MIKRTLQIYRQPRFIISTSDSAELSMVIRIFWVVYLVFFFVLRGTLSLFSFLFCLFFFSPFIFGHVNRVSGKYFWCSFSFVISFSCLLNWSALEICTNCERDSMKMIWMHFIFWIAGLGKMKISKWNGQQQRKLNTWMMNNV